MTLLPKGLLRAFTVLIALTAALCADARIVRLVITKNEPYNHGQTYGAIGQYERVFGQAYGEVDPTNPLNSGIQDIRLAPRNARGMVEYITEFILLRPADISKTNSLLFLSLPNRGNVFPADSALLARGYLFFWAAWQGDVLAGDNRLLMTVPVATENGKTITGQVRAEYEVNTLTPTLPLNSGYFNGLSHHTYLSVSTDNATAVLTKRVHEADPRVEIDRADWAFADCSKQPFPGNPDAGLVSIKGGFDPDYIYELVYTAKDPLVLGLGFAAIRDLSAFLKHEIKDDAGNANPVLNGATTVPVKAAIMQGVSQCGNFKRTFLQLGFNQDEHKRMVFEGVNDHIGTRRISLNIRFGRPGGGGIRREDHYFPSNEPPFTWDSSFEPISGITGGILDACNRTHTTPKIIQSFSSSEYWQLRASLRTTSPDGKTDLVIPGNVRVYLFNSTQHSPASFADKVSGFTTNGNQYQPYLRALLVSLENWVMQGANPPASTYPTLANHTLVKPDNASMGWPDIPGVTYNGQVNDGPLLNFGPLYNIKMVTGILREPPVVVPGKYYHVLVPKVDADGNETGGVRSVTLLAPLGTYTGWSLRKKGYGEGDLNGLNGMFIPFKHTKAEREAANDPRLSLQERYSDHAGYVAAVTTAADKLVKQGFLLPADANGIIALAQKSDVLK
jgi:hypothetical protein